MSIELPKNFIPLTECLPERLWQGKHMVGEDPNGFPWFRFFVVCLESQRSDGAFGSRVVESHLTEKAANDLCDRLGRFDTVEGLN